MWRQKGDMAGGNDRYGADRSVREIYDYPVVRINNKIVSRPQFDHTTVPDGAVVFLIPLVAGG